MLKTVEDISTTKKRLKIEIPADTLEDEITDSLEKVKKTATIPGFRTGRAPMTFIEKKFGKKVEGEVLDRIIPRVYVDALKEADIIPVTDPVLEGGIDFKRREPVSLTLTIEVMPKITNLTYENLSIRDIAASVDDTEVESVLKRSQEEKAAYEPSEGPVGMNDLLSFDYASDGGEITVKDQIYKVGGSLFPEDFALKLIGRKKGDALSVESVFPEEHPSEKLAGKRLTLNVVINDIKKANLPAIDDEFAKDLGLDNLDALRNHVREETLKAKKNEVVKIQKAEIMKKLLETHEFDAPEAMIENETTMLATDDAVGRQEKENIPEKEDSKAAKEELKARAVRNVKAMLLLAAIGRKENISVSEDEIKSSLLSMSKRFGVPPESLMKFYISKEGSLEGLKNSIFEDKVLERIISKAVLEKGE